MQYKDTKLFNNLEKIETPAGADSSIPSVIEQERKELFTVKDEYAEIVKQAEEVVLLRDRLKKVSLKLTTKNDWIDMAGQAYLRASGAERLMDAFGINLIDLQRDIIEEENGHFHVIYRGVFKWRNREFIVEGARSSKDPFFCRRKTAKGEIIEIPPDQINRASVIKSAFSNLIARGVSIILGLRNLTWDDLKDIVKPEEVTKVEFKK